MGQRVARESKLTEEQVTRVLNALGPAVRDELTKGNTVNLPGLGILRVVRVAEHKDMEAGTGRLLRIPAKNTVEFLATDGLGEAANSATCRRDGAGFRVHSAAEPEQGAEGSVPEGGRDAHPPSWPVRKTTVGA